MLLVPPPAVHVIRTEPVTSLAWAPNGTMVAASTTDGMIRLWDTETYKDRLETSYVDANIASLAWTPDGTQLAGGAENGRILLWELEIPGQEPGNTRTSHLRHQHHRLVAGWQATRICLTQHPRLGTSHTQRNHSRRCQRHAHHLLGMVAGWHPTRHRSG